jgi:hypothetical protein
MALLRSSHSLVVYLFIMATYEVKLTFKTLSNPREVVELIASKVKEAIPVLSITHSLLEDRPTSDEHHGGVTNEDELTNYRVNADGTKTDLSRGFIP